jgi:hypothetical protein
MLTKEIIPSLFVSCNNYSFKETCEHEKEVLVVYVLCGANRHQAMNDQGSYDIEWRFEK